MPRLLISALACLFIAYHAPAGVTFKVTVDPALAPQPVSGRLIVSLIGPGATLSKGEDPNNAPFWNDPDQPLFGMDVVALSADHPIALDDAADSRVVKPSQLPPGEYRAAARLVTTRLTSSWRHDPGNLHSATVKFTVVESKTTAASQEIELKLSRVTKRREWPTPDKSHGAVLIDVRSKLLSDFHKRDVYLHAGLVPPVDYDAKRNYAAIYEVPGFGGDHFGALHEAQKREHLTLNPPEERGKPSAELDLLRSTFHIVLDPESPNGHTLFADSANNGPCGRALIEELIPAIEAIYPLIPRPEARLLRGHSSGGWSTLWLALNYPQTFGAAWSSSPDPVDFRRLQLVDLYAQHGVYNVGANRRDNDGDQMARLAKVPHAYSRVAFPCGGRDLVSYRGREGPIMTIAQEARNEDLLGPDNTSGQQWDSWFAAWGPVNERGHPAALFDPKTGVINKPVLDHYRKYDLSLLLRNDPAKYGPIFQNNVRLAVGDADDFFLNEAVALLKIEVDKLPKPPGELKFNGYIKIVPGLDHGSIGGSQELRAFPRQMHEHLKAHGLTPPPARPERK